MERLQDEKQRLENAEHNRQEENRKIQRNIRSINEQLSEYQTKEFEAHSRKTEIVIILLNT